MIDWPDDLVSSLARRRAVIFVGSGVSANSQGVDGRSPPLWGEFLSAALKKCDGNTKHIADLIKMRDYLSACELIRYRMGDDWIRFLQDNFVTPKYSIADIHKYIFRLDSLIVITPNFDNIYDRWSTSESGGTVAVKKYYSEDISRILDGRSMYILKLHGDIHEPEKLIFTRKDYARARISYPNAYRIVESLIMTHSFLFVGCGVDDPDISLLLEDYSFRCRASAPHFILLPKPVHEDFVKMLKETRSLRVISYDKRDRHQELVESLKSLVESVDTRRSVLARELSW